MKTVLISFVIIDHATSRIRDINNKHEDARLLFSNDP